MGLLKRRQFGAWLRALLVFACFFGFSQLCQALMPLVIATMALRLDNAILSSAVSSFGNLSAALCFSGLILAILIGAVLSRTRLIKGASPRWFVALAVISATGIAFRVMQFPLCIDDAYIDFRYVFNLLRGVGLIYQFTPFLESQTHNVLGISSPLHIAVLTAACLLFGSTDVPQISRLCNLGLDELNLLLLSFLVFRLSARRSLVLLAAAIYALNSYSIYEVGRGKETPLVVSLILGYLLLVSHGRAFLSTACAGLIAITRPEGVFFLIGDFLARQLWRSHSFSLSSIKKVLPLYIIPALIFASTQIIQCLLSGTFVPSGMVAKWIIYDRPVYFGFEQLSECLIAFLFGRELPLAEFAGQIALALQNTQVACDLVYVLFGLVYFALLSTFALLAFKFRELGGYTISLYLLGLFFGVLNAVMVVFPWYYAWWVPLAALFWVLVLKNIEGKFLFSCVYIFALLVPWLSWSINVRPGEFLFPGGKDASLFVLPIYRIDAMQSRLPSYEAAARFVADKCGNSQESVAAGELGMLGYNLPAVKIIDLHGIISPDMLKLYERNRPYRKSNSLIRFPSAFYSVLRPDWIIVFDLFLPEGLLQSEDFRKQYEVVRFFPHKVFGEGTTGLYVLKRRTSG